MSRIKLQPLHIISAGIDVVDVSRTRKGRKLGVEARACQR